MGIGSEFDCFHPASSVHVEEIEENHVCFSTMYGNMTIVDLEITSGNLLYDDDMPKRGGVRGIPP